MYHYIFLSWYLFDLFSLHILFDIVCVFISHCFCFRFCFCFCFCAWIGFQVALMIFRRATVSVHIHFSHQIILIFVVICLVAHTAKESLSVDSVQGGSDTPCCNFLSSYSKIFKVSPIQSNPIQSSPIQSKPSEQSYAFILFVFSIFHFHVHFRFCTCFLFDLYLI